MDGAATSTFLEESAAACDRLEALTAEALIEGPGTLMELCGRVHAAYGGLPADRVRDLAMTVDGHLADLVAARRATSPRAAARVPGAGMKIVELRTTAVAVPQKRTYRSSWRRSGHGTNALQAVLVELVTDEGLTGIGEAPVVWAGSAAVTTRDDRGGRAAGGRRRPARPRPDPAPPLYAETGMAHLGTQGVSWALSGIDTALWDLTGRILGPAAAPPVGRSLAHALRRSTPTSCPTSRSGWSRTRWRGWPRGSGRCTSRSGSRPRWTRRACAPSARRSATGRACGSTPTAPGRRVSRSGCSTASRAYDLEYIEQPIPPGDPEELARLRARVAVPILAHESSLSVEGTLAVVRHGAADAVQLDPRFDAGIAGCPHRRADRRGCRAARAHAHVRRARRRDGADAALPRRAPQPGARLADLLPEPRPTTSSPAARCGSTACFLDVPTGAGSRRRSRSRARQALRGVPRRARWPGRPPPPDDPYYDRDYLIRPRV